MTKGTTSAPFSAPTVVILGTDLLLTARPATPVQLAHACLAAGYTAALPVSWGDELLASSLALRASVRGRVPVIACACPYVADRFAGELDRFLLPVASPPVATARYVRELYAGPVHITYVGACPGAHDPSIDALYTPGEFLARLRELGIDADDQPVVFESVIPPDRRRFESLPGGIPTSDALRRAGASHALLELEGEDYVIALAQRLFEREAVLIDVAPRLGCACAGAVSAGSLRAAVAALEPPRARTPVVESALSIDVDAPARPARVPLSHPAPPPPPPIPVPEPAVAAARASTTPTRTPTDAYSPDESDIAEREEPVEESPHVPVIAHADLPDERGRHRSPAMGVPRVGSGTPVSRTQQGRVVPRAYLRRRRPWGDLEPPAAATTSPREPDAPSEPSEPTAPLADMPADRVASDMDRQAHIATHVEPAADQKADEPSRAAPREVEIPISRIGLPEMAACDLIPPPPIMPDLHLGDSLAVADSLADLIGFEVTLRHPAQARDLPEIAEPALYAPSPMAPSMSPAPSKAEPVATTPAEPVASVAPVIAAAPTAPPAPTAAPTTPASRRDAPYSTPRAIEDLIVPRPRTVPSTPHPLPPAVSAPPRREMPPATPATPAAPATTAAAAATTPTAPTTPTTPLKSVETPVSVPRTVRVRPPMILPPRRRATTAMIWILVGALIALVVLSVRMLVTDRMATASPRGDSTRVIVADSLARDSAITPTLPPLVVDSTPVAESTATPAVVAPTGPPAGAPARARPPARTAPRRAPTPRPSGRAPGPTITLRQQPASVPNPAPSRVDSARPNAVRDTVDSAEFNAPRVTRPWPPPAQ